MHKLTKLIREDMVPALGVTEPGAIAFCVAKARSYAGGELKHLRVVLNSGMYKNAFTCGIPNSGHYGTACAAALGFVAGNAEKGLEALADAVPADSLQDWRCIPLPSMRRHRYWRKDKETLPEQVPCSPAP